MSQSDRPTVPAPKSAQEAAHYYFHASAPGLPPSDPCYQTYLALCGKGPVTEGVLSMLRRDALESERARVALEKLERETK